MKRMQLSMVLASALTLTAAIAAQAATNAQKCEAAKLKAAGKYHFCRLKADRKAVLNGGLPNYSACNSTLTTKWTAAETVFGVACPTFGDQATRQSEATTDAADMALRLSGGTPPFCGDATKNGSEDCDGADLGGASCTSVGYSGGTLVCSSVCTFGVAACTGGLSSAFPASGQTTAYTADKNSAPASAVPDDGTLEAGATLQYVDNGDGTVTDLNTGLIWEKKSDDGGLHDKDATYPWSNASLDTIWDWLDDVNAEGGTGFAGHNDWRIPNVKELQSIVNYEIGYPGPTVAAAFNTGCMAACTVTSCSCTAQYAYWSSSTYADTPAYAWLVGFIYGGVFEGGKNSPLSVRAVRSGS